MIPASSLCNHWPVHVVFTWYDPRETYQQNLLRVKSQVHARLKRFVCQQCVVPGTMAGRHTRTCTSLMPGGISWAVGPRCNFVGAEAIEAYSHLPGTQPFISHIDKVLRAMFPWPVHPAAVANSNIRSLEGFRTEVLCGSTLRSSRRG